MKLHDLKWIYDISSSFYISDPYSYCKCFITHILAKDSIGCLNRNWKKITKRGTQLTKFFLEPYVILTMAILGKQNYHTPLIFYLKFANSWMKVTKDRQLYGWTDTHEWFFFSYMYPCQGACVNPKPCTLTPKKIGRARQKGQRDGRE